ncbi:hypothetical protein CLV69_102767 [Amycolatopsis arida]|nr:hypothetical protein CLV69_102767 [Amycolatopsis arida]
MVELVYTRVSGVEVQLRGHAGQPTRGLTGRRGTAASRNSADTISDCTSGRTAGRSSAGRPGCSPGSTAAPRPTGRRGPPAAADLAHPEHGKLGLGLLGALAVVQVDHPGTQRDATPHRLDDLRPRPRIAGPLGDRGVPSRVVGVVAGRHADLRLGVAILAGPGGPVLRALFVTRRRRALVAILAGPGGPVLRALFVTRRRRALVAILAGPGGPALPGMTRDSTSRQWVEASLLGPAGRNTPWRRFGTSRRVGQHYRFRTGVLGRIREPVRWGVTKAAARWVAVVTVPGSSW